MSDSKYTIASGLENETFVHEDYGTAITAANLTDEAAEFFISKGYEHAFVRKPSAAVPADSDKKPKLKHKADYQARFKEVFGADADDAFTIDTLKEHIEAKEADADYQLPTA